MAIIGGILKKWVESGDQEFEDYQAIKNWVRRDGQRNGQFTYKDSQKLALERIEYIKQIEGVRPATEKINSEKAGNKNQQVLSRTESFTKIAGLNVTKNGSNTTATLLSKTYDNLDKVITTYKTFGSSENIANIDYLRYIKGIQIGKDYKEGEGVYELGGVTIEYISFSSDVIPSLGSNKIEFKLTTDTNKIIKYLSFESIARLYFNNVINFKIPTVTSSTSIYMDDRDSIELKFSRQQVTYIQMALAYIYGNNILWDTSNITGILTPELIQAMVTALESYEIISIPEGSTQERVIKILKSSWLAFLKLTYKLSIGI